MKNKKVMKLASEGKRFGAACIDSVLPVFASCVFIITGIVEAFRGYAYGQNFGYGFDVPGFGYGYGYSMGPSGGAVAAMIISSLLIIVFIVVQLIFFNRSTTFGKAALGLQVVSSKDGEPVGFWKMLFREVLVKQASGSVLLLGYIWILIDDKNRGWHDKILDTYVVDLRESAALSAPAAPKAEPKTEYVYRPEPKSQPLPAPAAVQEPAPQKAAEEPAPQKAAVEPAVTIPEPEEIKDISHEEAVIELPGETQTSDIPDNSVSNEEQ